MGQRTKKLFKKYLCTPLKSPFSPLAYIEAVESNCDSLIWRGRGIRGENYSHIAYTREPYRLLGPRSGATFRQAMDATLALLKEHGALAVTHAAIST